MRRLALTSPEIRGEDVRTLQHILNERLEHYRSRHRIDVNGIYDRDTAHVVSEIAYLEGLHTYDGTVGVLRAIEHPHLRNPQELAVAKQRKKAREAADKAIGGTVVGLARIVALAEHYVGVQERPPGSNWGSPYPAKWEEEFGFDSGVSWCGCFAGGMIVLAGGHVTSRVAFCPYVEADARSKTNGFDLWVPNHTEGVEPGWTVLYNWVGGSEPQHIGIVKRVTPDFIETIEGNTSGSNPSDGGMVAIERRSYNFTVGYARPRI